MTPCCSCGGDRRGNARGGRELCRSCYDLARHRGILGSYPRATRPVGDVLEDYVFLRADGVTPRNMPARLGMTRAAFERALYRARKRGDARVLPWQGVRS